MLLRNVHNPFSTSRASSVPVLQQSVDACHPVCECTHTAAFCFLQHCANTLYAFLTYPAASCMDESSSSLEAASSESAEWWQRVPQARLQVVRILPRDFHLECLFRNIHQEPNLHTYVLEPDLLNILLSQTEGSRILVLLPVRSWYYLTCSASWSNTCLRHLLARHV